MFERWRIEWLVVVVLFLAGCDPEQTLLSQPVPMTVPVPETQPENNPPPNDWPFGDPENFAVFTLKRVLDGTRPILYVVHDEAGDWQFLDGADVDDEEAAIVALKRIVERDPTIKTLSDLPVGWAAEREATDKTWQRFPR